MFKTCHCCGRPFPHSYPSCPVCACMFSESEVVEKETPKALIENADLVELYSLRQRTSAKAA